MINAFLQDIRQALRSDPALKAYYWSRLEIVLYPGLHAMFLHRIAHALWLMKIPFVPRLISQISRFFTGIEIHPGAKFGPGVFIDHGNGVVIGETAEIGESVLIYHQVTLGGTSLLPGKRHPTIGNGVMIGAGAKLFGPITVGNNSQIAGGAIVTRDIPADCVVVGNPARIVKREGLRVLETLDTMHLPDPIKSRLEKLERRADKLEKGFYPDYQI